jgi:iron complex transport system ATP-binding protein
VRGTAVSATDATPTDSSSGELERIVELRGVRAWRGDTLVFEDLTLDILRGEHTAILGPNGAGKSTLLRLLSREIHPEHREAGSMRLFGRERWNVWDLRSRLGLVSHDLQVDYSPYSTGSDVVLSGYYSSLGVWSHQRFTADDRDRARELLTGFGIGGLGEKRYAAMSTGEQRRLLLARALVHEPEVLVLDEPTSGLDPKACIQYLETVRGLMASGKTVILVTHHIHEIPPEIGRVLLLKDGRIVADGPKAEILTNHRISELFEAPLEVVRAKGFYQVVPADVPEAE